MRIYLSYPMSGKPGNGIPRATRIADRLRAAGLNIVVPHEIMHGDGQHENPAFTHADYIREDVKLGLLADGVGAIALVDGWPYSKGCMAEFNAAVTFGYRVLQVVEEYDEHDRLHAYLISVDGKGEWSW